MFVKRIYSDHPSFREVILRPGFNLIVADKDKESSNRKSRNGSGKSSLVELISFLMGGDSKRGASYKNSAFKGYRFGIDIDHHGNAISVIRDPFRPKYIQISETLSGVLRCELQDGVFISTNDEWKEYLGREMFGFPGQTARDEKHPTFRSIFSYFVRSPKGLISPERTYPLQTIGSVQSSLSFIFGLDWKIANEFDQVRSKEKLIKALGVASKEGMLGSVVGSPSEIQAEIHVRESRLSRLRVAINEFRVLPEYEERERRASEITQEMSVLSVEDSADREWMAQLQASMSDERPPSEVMLERLFREANINIPELVVRRYEEVQEFHRSVVSNRKAHLAGEIESLGRKISERAQQKDRLDRERAQHMLLLRSHGALEQYLKLQDEYARQQSDLGVLREKHALSSDLDIKKTEAKIDRSLLLRRNQIDFVDRSDQIRIAVVTFSDISGRLYEVPGLLSISPTQNGPEFEFDIPAKGSAGVNKMQIFCFDMTMISVMLRRGIGPLFIAHDSHIYDGVDDRQVALALQYSKEFCDSTGYQYIATMNSDVIPKPEKFPAMVELLKHIALRIDDTPTGGLFGMRF